LDSSTAHNLLQQTEPLAALMGGDGLESVKLRSGRSVECNALFVRPAQHPTPLVASLQLERDDMGYVRIDAKRETSMKGIFAAGDATTMMQSAIAGAAEGMIAAAMLNHTLAAEDSAPR
jgi:thioredoxin reductase